MKDESNWWWIDFMEGELDPSTHPDIEFLLEKSPEDREEYESWRLLRTWIKEVDVTSEINWSKSDLEDNRQRILKGLGSEFSDPLSDPLSP